MEVNIQTIAQHANKMVRAEKVQDMRKKHGSNTIVLFKIGDFYETYGDSAYDMAQATGVTLSYSGNIKYSAFPKKSEDTYFARLIRKGYKIAILDNE